MRPIDDPTPLKPDRRREEVASTLAAGVIRLHARAALSPEGSSEKSPELTSERLGRRWTRWSRIAGLLAGAVPHTADGEWYTGGSQCR